MRVLMTTDTVGGVWTFTRELAQQLTLRGHSVALVSFGRIPSGEQNAWAEAMKMAHPDLFVFCSSDTPLEWMQDNDLVWSQGAGLLMEVANNFLADILHSNQFCWGALSLDLPKLITAHSDVRSWAATCRSEAPGASLWLDRYDELLQDGIDGADAIVSPTRWMRETLPAHYEVHAPSRVIPNGRTSSEAAAESKRDLRAVTVGRLWDEGKGLAILSDIVPPLPIFMAGECSFQSTVSHDLGSVATALGALDEKSLFELLSTSSVYIATSVYEPFGLAPLEAALCGCAIVARDIPSFREVWGDAALYFKDGVDLENALERLASDRSMLKALMIAAAARAHTFTAERMADRYISMYGELISQRLQSKTGVEEEMHAA